MVARARKTDETFEEYREKLRIAADELKQKLIGRYIHVSHMWIPNEKHPGGGVWLKGKKPYRKLK